MLQGRADHETGDRHPGVERELVNEQDPAVGLGQEPPGALHVRDRAADAVDVDARVRHVIEPEHVLERRQEEGRLDRLLEELCAASVELLELGAALDVRHVLGRDFTSLEHVPDRGCRSVDFHGDLYFRRERPVAAHDVDLDLARCDRIAVEPFERRLRGRAEGAAEKRERRESHQREDQSPATGLRSVPMPLISTSTVSPAFIQRGGLRPAPTPPGVPVTMTSPGSSCAHAEQYSMSCGTSKQSSPTLSCCITAPFKRVLSVSLRGSEISSVVTSHGPNEPLAWKFLPGVNCPECRW